MVIWSLFDGSGIIGLPWAQAGHTVFCFNADGADHGEYEIKMQHENLHYVNHWIDSSFDPVGFIIKPWSGLTTISKPDIRGYGESVHAAWRTLHAAPSVRYCNQ